MLISVKCSKVTACSGNDLFVNIDVGLEASGTEGMPR